jgi:hypothetical protein
MLRSPLLLLMVLIASAGCPGGGGALGAMCAGGDDCSQKLQCLNSRCVARCERAPDCGDGYACDEAGVCQAGSQHAGDTCMSEVECAAGLSCQIDGAAAHSDNHLVASCTAENASRPAGSECNDDGDCRNGTCALGHCVDLCQQDRDCGAGNSCATIPSLVVSNALFKGCLLSQGALSWSIPVTRPTAEVLLPVPTGAMTAELVMSVDDINQKVGATNVISPDGNRIYTQPCLLSDPSCTPTDQLNTYFGNAQRHAPAFGQSVLAMPSGTNRALATGVYRVQVSSLRADDSAGSALPRVTAVVRLNSGVVLDLHFFFLDLADHPCAASTNHLTLNAATASSEAFFKYTYLDELRAVFTRAALAIGTVTYEDVTDRPALDGLDIADVGELLKLGKYATGINVFFVRSLSPIGLQAFAPNPGPAGVAGTPQSGIVIGLDTLCYRDWTAVARLTAHELARYMGLYHNVEIDTAAHPSWSDQIDDDDLGAPSSNLMFFSELDGGPPPSDPVLSAEQREILTRSAVMHSAGTP